MDQKQPKIALVFDWLTNFGGAERVLLAMHKIYPDAPIYTSVFEAEKMPQFAGMDIRTTYLQHLPKFLRQRHQLFPVFRASAFRRLDLSEYDIVISITTAEAKAVRVRPDAIHICYCNTPIRYYWSHYEEYRKEPGFGALNPLIRLLIPPFVALMRPIDLKTVKGVDYFISNSHEIKRRVEKYYHRDSEVIWPPVDTQRLQPSGPVQKDDYYLVVGRQTPYKRVDLAIQACNRLGKRLVVIGRGSEHGKLVKLAGPTVEFPAEVNDQQIVEYFQKARGFIFAPEEDFGITPIEAMSAGTPVIAFKKGGALDYVVEGKTGVFFEEQTVESLVEAIGRFEQMQFDQQELIEHTRQFAESEFARRITGFVAAHRQKPNL